MFLYIDLLNIIYDHYSFYIFYIFCLFFFKLFLFELILEASHSSKSFELLFPLSLLSLEEEELLRLLIKN